MAALQYESANGFFPPGKWFHDLGNFLEMQSLIDGWIRNPTPSNPPQIISQVQCPSDSPIGTSNYFGNYGDMVDTRHFEGNGTIVSPVYFDPSLKLKVKLWRGVRVQQIEDGTSTTSLFSEALSSLPMKRDRVVFLDNNYVLDGTEEAVDQFVDFVRNAPGDGQFNESDILGPMRGRFLTATPDGEGSILRGFFISSYNHVLTPQQPSGIPRDANSGVLTASSAHPGGVNVAFADGHVEFVGNEIEENAWRQIGCRNDSSQTKAR